MGRWREALYSYKMTVRFDPSNVEAWFDFGETLLEYGYLKKALMAFNRCIELQPKWADPYYSRAKVLFRLRKTLDALESLKLSFQMDPEKKKQFEKEFPGVHSIKEFTNLLEK